MGRPRIPIRDRFDKFVNKTDACWLWTGHCDEKGYGVIGIWSNGKIRFIRAHRLSYILNIGEIPKGLSVLHHCDVRGCVNPDHLYAGTQAQNMQDMRDRNRQPKYEDVEYRRGEESHLSVVTAKDVIELRRRCANGEDVKAVHSDMALPITVGGARRIVARKCWRHL